MITTPSTYNDLIEENRLLKERDQLRTEQLNLMNQQVKYLTEQIEWFRRQIFGKRSEKIIELSNERQLMIPGCEPLEISKPTTQPISAHTRKKPERNGQDKITLPDNLPIERQIIDIPENEKICKETGLPLVKIGEE